MVNWREQNELQVLVLPGIPITVPPGVHYTYTTLGRPKAALNLTSTLLDSANHFLSASLQTWGQ